MYPAVLAITVVLAVQATKSGAAEKLLPPSFVVSLNAPKVRPNPADASSASVTATPAPRADFLRPDHNAVLLRLGLFPPDRHDLVHAEQQDRNHDEEESPDGAIHVEQDEAELHHPESHHADCPVRGDGPLLAVRIGIALGDEVHLAAESAHPPDTMGDQAILVVRVPVGDNVADLDGHRVDPPVHHHARSLD